MYAPPIQPPAAFVSAASASIVVRSRDTRSGATISPAACRRARFHDARRAGRHRVDRSSISTIKPETGMQPEENKEIVRRMIQEAQIGGNLAVIDELFAVDFVNHTNFPGMPDSRDGVKLVFGTLQAAFPDLDVSVRHMVAEGDDVVTRKTFTGTHGGDFFGLPPTGRPVAFDVIDILRLRDGRITDHWNVVDMFGLMQQLTAG
jgi:steroid delta-isomerase-like uncharacterized protein